MEKDTKLLNSQSIRIDISKQKLYLVQGSYTVKIYSISTSKFGVGSKSGSNKTPLGLHRISNKIGRNALTGATFIKRRNTGKVVKIKKKASGRLQDLITTRIMRLEGLEQGVNRGVGIDSFQRSIYIHGTPDEGLIGKPASHGCIRMKNKDVIELFDLVNRGTLVNITR